MPRPPRFEPDSPLIDNSPDVTDFDRTRSLIADSCHTIFRRVVVDVPAFLCTHSSLVTESHGVRVPNSSSASGDNRQLVDGRQVMQQSTTVSYMWTLTCDKLMGPPTARESDRCHL